MNYGSFKNVIYKQCVYKSYMYKKNLALNNLRGLIYHKTQPFNQSTFNIHQCHDIQLSWLRIHLRRRVRNCRAQHQQAHWYDNKQSDCGVSVMLKCWGIQCIFSLPSLPGPLSSEVVAPDRVLPVD